MRGPMNLRARDLSVTCCCPTRPVNDCESVLVLGLTIRLFSTAPFVAAHRALTFLTHA
ncbi:MAG: hypothetical protein JWL59_4363 [Chthoniobacteraceae bacterium]|nr:hypothetical protein [Chthoniobacteraceae bacterium]